MTTSNRAAKTKVDVARVAMTRAANASPGDNHRHD